MGCGWALGDDIEFGFADQVVSPGVDDAGADLQRLVEGAQAGLGETDGQSAGGLAGRQLDRSRRDAPDVNRQGQLDRTCPIGSGAARNGERQLDGVTGPGDD